MRVICFLLLSMVLSWSLASCSDRIEASTPPYDFKAIARPEIEGKFSEVSPPPIIQELRKATEKYQPQVAILSPQTDEVFQQTSVDVRLQVKDLPIYKNSQLNIGPHLNLILDNEPLTQVYEINKPITLKDLSPGTHTLRVIAVRPWNESFKNEGSYAQTKFHILTKTESNNPDPSLPLLTYNSPSGVYGAEPILLDFYLTNTPLHLVALSNHDDQVKDWRIRVTINGESFLLDNWQSIYLKGFTKGNNWVQLEFIDEQGNKIDNVFNNTVRLITYDPDYQNTLAKLVQGKFPIEIARGIVDPDYQIPATVDLKEKETVISKPEENPLPEIEKTSESEIVLPKNSEELEQNPPEVNHAIETESPQLENIKPEDEQTNPDLDSSVYLEKNQPELPISIPENLETPAILDTIEKIELENNAPELPKTKVGSKIQTFLDQKKIEPSKWFKSTVERFWGSELN